MIPKYGTKRKLGKADVSAFVRPRPNARVLEPQRVRERDVGPRTSRVVFRLASEVAHQCRDQRVAPGTSRRPEQRHHHHAVAPVPILRDPRV